MKFKSTKKFGPISTGHRQWKHKGHCSYVHGYGRYVRLSFEASELDECGWVMDFGDLRDVKRWIEGEWDHKVLIAADDPLLSQLQKLEFNNAIILYV